MYGGHSPPCIVAAFSISRNLYTYRDAVEAEEIPPTPCSALLYMLAARLIDGEG